MNFMNERCTCGIDRVPVVTISVFVLQLCVFYSSQPWSSNMWYAYGYRHPEHTNWFSPLTYSVFHIDVFHLWSNMGVFVISGAIIELTEASVRLAVVLLISTPMAAMGHGLVSTAPVVGASGFVYATIAYQLALAFKNWREMRILRDSPVFTTFTSIISSVYMRVFVAVLLLVMEFAFSNTVSNTSHGGHALGALAGLTVGIVIGSNVRIDFLEVVLPCIGLLMYIVGAMAIAAASGQILCLVYLIVCFPILIWYVLQEWMQWIATWHVDFQYDPPRIIVARRVG